jgi:hypothetical protein
MPGRPIAFRWAHSQEEIVVETSSTSKPQFGANAVPSGRPQGFGQAGQAAPTTSSRRQGPEEGWIAEAESQVAMRRALMDCYNG